MKSPFTIECDKFIFDEKEISMLSDYGWFFLQLATGIRKPENDLQKQFIEVHKGLIAPSDKYQKLWFKYVTRCEWEKGNHSDWQSYHDQKLRALIIKSHVKPSLKISSSESGTKTASDHLWNIPRKRRKNDIPEFPKKRISRIRRKNDIPEEYRRRIDEGMGGSREDWKRNRRRYDG